MYTEMKSIFESQIKGDFGSAAKLRFLKCRLKRKSTCIKSQFKKNNPWILQIQELTQMVDVYDSQHT